MSRQRSRLLGSRLLLLLAGTLALVACNSSSVSGSQPKPPTATNAENKTPANGQRPQGLIGAAVSQIR
jgi:hypothetical protein